MTAPAPIYRRNLDDAPRQVAVMARAIEVGHHIPLHMHRRGQVLDKQFYAGPETQVYGGDGYAQWRVGIHITSFRTGNAEWSAAGGWAVDSNHRSSPYLRLGFMQRE
jgi:Cellulose biosynthesis protein BcsS